MVPGCPARVSVSSLEATEYAKRLAGPGGLRGGVGGVGSLVRIVLVALLMVATAACSGYRFPGAAPAGTGTVGGRVTVVPCAPIEPTTQPCKVGPGSGVEIDFTSERTTVAAHADADGAYSVELPAGTWKVSFKGYLRIIKGPLTVTVNPGSSVVADFVVDSGIRVSN